MLVRNFRDIERCTSELQLSEVTGQLGSGRRVRAEQFPITCAATSIVISDSCASWLACSVSHRLVLSPAINVAAVSDAFGDSDRTPRCSHGTVRLLVGIAVPLFLEINMKRSKRRPLAPAPNGADCPRQRGAIEVGAEPESLETF